MARDHARVSLGIWGDDDWRDLTPAAQHLYFVLLTHSSLNYAGVADWRPARLRALAQPWGAAEFNRAAEELARNLYIVVDEGTEEVLIRSFVKHDGLMKQPNMAVSMVRGYEAIASRHLRTVFVHELKRLHESDPDLGGWKSCKQVLDNRSVDPSTYPTGYPPVAPQLDPPDNPSVDPSVDPSVKGEPSPSGDPCPTPTPTPGSLLPTPRKTSARSGYSPEFEAFWSAYPRKESKPNAWKAWTKALNRATVEQITAGARRYADDPNREDGYTKHGATWLNADGWDDAPLPPRNGGTRAAAQHTKAHAWSEFETEDHLTYDHPDTLDLPPTHYAIQGPPDDPRTQF